MPSLPSSGLLTYELHRPEQDSPLFGECEGSAAEFVQIPCGRRKKGLGGGCACFMPCSLLVPSTRGSWPAPHPYAQMKTKHARTRTHTLSLPHPPPLGWLSKAIDRQDARCPGRPELGLLVASVGFGSHCPEQTDVFNRRAHSGTLWPGRSNPASAAGDTPHSGSAPRKEGFGADPSSLWESGM